MKQLWCSSIMQDSHSCNPGFPVDVSFDDDDGKIVLKIAIMILSKVFE